MKIYSAIYNDYAHLDDLFPEATCLTINNPDELDEPGILIIHGGSDISPTIYNQAPIKQTQATAKLSKRDETELALMKHAVKKGIFIYGICRGAQLACCLAGGSLIQHVTNHQSAHMIYTSTIKLEANSAHHQMMNLKNTVNTPLAWTPTGTSACYLSDGEEKIPDFEPDIVWFPEIKALAVQGHPEWLYPSNKYVKFCNNLILNYFRQPAPKQGSHNV